MPAGQMNIPCREEKLATTPAAIATDRAIHVSAGRSRKKIAMETANIMRYQPIANP